MLWMVTLVAHLSPNPITDSIIVMVQLNVNILISKLVCFFLEGKSTTASMLAYVLHAMGDDLTAVVGAHVPQVSPYFMQFDQYNLQTL